MQVRAEGKLVFTMPNAAESVEEKRTFKKFYANSDIHLPHLALDSGGRHEGTPSVVVPHKSGFCRKSLMAMVGTQCPGVCPGIVHLPCRRGRAIARTLKDIDMSREAVDET